MDPPAISRSMYYSAWHAVWIVSIAPSKFEVRSFWSIIKIASLRSCLLTEYMSLWSPSLDDFPCLIYKAYWYKKLTQGSFKSFVNNRVYSESLRRGSLRALSKIVAGSWACKFFMIFISLSLLFGLTTSRSSNSIRRWYGVAIVRNILRGIGATSATFERR